ncbi:inactive beta-amylase 9 [Olea europaea subsp. europaea]|uniref:Beta-amylase n=1 Tax=Olea europaea subsp. europaea TaxID=158383 RepID=A0A8S0UPW9_OLEEU|nr:inactive beta-amylase 9 [Olea europaea subsp. europaea]
MEIPVIRSSQLNLGRAIDVGFCNFSKNLNSKIFSVKNNSKTCKIFQGQSLKWESKSATRFTLKASATAQSEAAVISEKGSRNSRTKPTDGVKLYVGLPLDAVSTCNTVNHARAISAGLKALKLLGIDGVELPVWWGIAEKDKSGKYDWTGYLVLAEMVQKLGLKLHVSLCFHASKDAKILLPDWVSRIGESQPDVYFTDRSGQRYKDCLSLAVDDLPVLDGKTPIEAYAEFCESFKASFSPFIGSTITGISIGLGPDGELRYPSHHYRSKNNSHRGAGEFQCYNKYMLENLKQHAETHGNPLWGLSGPHDAPGYSQSPMSSGFFLEHGGSWEMPYGDFFLSWYSSQLISHGDRILSVAASTFEDTEIIVSGKVPLMHSWYKTRSHPSELTAGFYNTANRDGYEAIAEIFSRNSCKIILPGMDLSEENEPNESRSRPELLLAQIASACGKHEVQISGENSLVSVSPRGYEQIKKNLVDQNVVDLFTYQRMGAYFFSPEHFPSYTKFVRSLNQANLHSDDLVTEEEGTAVSLPGTNLRMQAA